MFDGYPPPETEGRGLKEYLAIARRHPWIILGMTMLFGGAAAWLVLTAPPKYRATAVVRISDTRRAMAGRGEANGLDQMMSREADLLLSQIQVLMSRQNVGRVVDSEGLRLSPAVPRYVIPEISHVIVAADTRADSVRLSFGEKNVELRAAGESASGQYGAPLSAGGVTLVVDSRPPVAVANFVVLSRNDAISGLLDAFKAVPRPKTDVIDLQFVAGEPHYAQRVANAMAFTFQNRNAELAQQTSRRRRIFLEEQIKQTDAMLERAMAEYSGFRSGNQVFSSDIKGKAQQQGLVEVDIRRAELQAEKQTYVKLLAKARQGPESAATALRGLASSPALALNPVVKQLYLQFGSLEAQLDSLRAVGAAPTNPDVVALNRSISGTVGKLITAVEDHVSGVNAQLDALASVQTRSAAALAEEPRTETEESRLAQRVATIQKMSDQLQQDYQQARMSEAVEVGQVDIIDLAETPGSPVSEGKTRKMALGAIIGLMLGLGLAILRDDMNSSISRREDIERVLRVPGLAVIPQFAGMNGAGRFAWALPRRIGRTSRRRAHRATGLVTVSDTTSLSAEAYRTLRTNLLFSQAVQSLRTVVVTSAAPSEGKTTTAANVAVSFAQQGMRVLIVDCDLRRSRLHKLFSVPREPGLTEFVLGHLDQDAAVRETAVAGLYVLPSGHLPPNPAELLGGQKMRAALAALSGAFDLVILDTPPLLAASDAAVLGRLVDGVILVVRAGQTETDAGHQAMQQLISVGAHVVGAVLNDPDSKVQRYGGYYKYEYASGS